MTKGTARIPGGGALPHCIVADKAFPLGWISCDHPPMAKCRTGCPMINPFLTTLSVGLGGLWKMRLVF